MKNAVQVYHHLGLGDHIICNGLVRELCKTRERVYCFVKKRNLTSVSFMYRDQPKIELVTVEDDWEVPFKRRKNLEFVKIGFENLDTSHTNFDENFYRQLGLDFRLRWDNFYVERAYEPEYQLLRQLNPDGRPYAFLHDDPSRGLLADCTRIGKTLKIISVGGLFFNGKLKAAFDKYNLFHWVSVLEHAQEIHCMDSSFKCLVESLAVLRNKRLFYHQYIRGSGPRAVSTMRQNWIVIKRPSLRFMANTIYTKTIHSLHSEANPDG